MKIRRCGVAGDVVKGVDAILNLYETPNFTIDNTQSPTPKQRQFMDAAEPFVLFGGAMGSGKSQGLAFAATQHIGEQRYRGLLMAHTDKQLAQAGGLYDILQNMFPDIPINRGTRQMRFPSGALLEFGTLPDSTAHLKRQGSTYQFIGVDEASNVLPAQLVWLPNRLRPVRGVDIPLRYRLTANPGGVAHDYLRSEYVDRPPDGKFRFIHAAADDNPFIDAELYQQQFAPLEALDAHSAEQLRFGVWTDPRRGAFFRVDCMRRYSALPTPKLAVRAWDLAATESAAADFTAGALVVECEGANGASDFYIHGLERGQLNAGDVENLILDTAATDGARVDIAIEQEQGAAGKLFIDRIRGKCDAPVTGMSPTGGKDARARITAGLMQDGRIYLSDSIPTAAARALESEFRRFGSPSATHDDIVDAVTYAVIFLTARG